MIRLYYMNIVWLSICVGPLSAESEIPVSGDVESTVILPCKLQSVNTETPFIRWVSRTKTVFERRGKESYQGVGFESRVDVPQEELRNGDCSLVLKNLIHTDAAIYKSYQIGTYHKSSPTQRFNMISRVNLSVNEKSRDELQDKSLSENSNSKVMKTGSRNGVGTQYSESLVVCHVSCFSVWILLLPMVLMC